MEALIWVQQTRLWKSVAHGREIVTPHASPLLALEEGWIHEEMPANRCCIVWRQALHNVDTPASIARGALEMFAELGGIGEMNRVRIVRLPCRRTIKQYNTCVPSFERAFLVIRICFLQARIGAAERFDIISVWPYVVLERPNRRV